MTKIWITQCLTRAVKISGHYFQVKKHGRNLKVGTVPTASVLLINIYWWYLIFSIYIYVQYIHKPLLTHWSYHNLALSLRYKIYICMLILPLLIVPVVYICSCEPSLSIHLVNIYRVRSDVNCLRDIWHEHWEPVLHRGSSKTIVGSYQRNTHMKVNIDCATHMKYVLVLTKP